MSTARKTLPAVLLLMLVVSFSSFSSFADVVDAAAETHLESSVAAISHQDSSAKIPPTGVNTGAQLFSVFMGLMLILGLILALAWVARRINGGGLMRQGPMKILASMPLGTRERMMVVEVGGEQLLIGVTASQINCLHVFPEPVIDAAGRDNDRVSDFGSKLMQLLQQKNLSGKTRHEHV